MNIHYKVILLVSTVILLLLSGCIKEDYDDCVQGIDVRFYSKTQCQTDTLYPEQIKGITLCVFDEDGLLVGFQKNNNSKIQRGYNERIEVKHGGIYTVVAWSGLDEGLFDIKLPQEMVTKKTDLLFRLKRTLRLASSIRGSAVYYGESATVYIPDADGSESIFKSTVINMQEVTNRLTIIVEGLDNAENYQVDIESGNGSMNINGSIAQDEIIDYSSVNLTRDNILEAQFTVLKLETGNTNTIVVKSKIDGRELYRGSLLGTLLLKNPDVNLDCDHDFVIRFTTKDQCSCGTYMIAEIWVNNWLVHSYDTDL